MNEAEELQDFDEEIQDNVEEQEPEQQQEPEVDPAEERALKMGWVPQDKFKGDPGKWRPADEFVERGETMIPLLNAKIRNLEKQQNAKDKAFSDYLGELRTKLHTDKVESLEGRKRQAVEEGDTAEYERLAKETVNNDLPEYAPPAQPTDQVFDEWVAENPWYSADYEKNQEAENYGRFLKNTNPGLDGKDFLNEITKHVRQKFANPNRDKASAVDGGTPKASSPPGKLYNTLEAEAKKTFQTFVQQGIFKNTVEDREAYAKDVTS